MSGIAIAGNNSGSADVQVQAPAVNTPRQYDLPKHGGKVAVFGVPAAVSATGTSVDFINGTGDVVIPDDASRITMTLSGISTNGTSIPLIQLGTSGGFDVTGYLGALTVLDSAVSTSSLTDGFRVEIANWSAATVTHGRLTLERQSGNTWVATGSFDRSDAARGSLLGGSKTLSGTLDRIRLTTVGGTNTFDAGTVSIRVE